MMIRCQRTDSASCFPTRSEFELPWRGSLFPPGRDQDYHHKRDADQDQDLSLHTSLKWFSHQVPRRTLIGKHFIEELGNNEQFFSCQQPVLSKPHHPQVAALLHIVDVIGVNASWVSTHAQISFQINYFGKYKDSLRKGVWDIILLTSKMFLLRWRRHLANSTPSAPSTLSR